MSGDTATQINYIVHPTYVERIDDGGDIVWEREGSLYDDLVLAGYPLNSSETLGAYFIDIGVRGEQVIVFTEQPAAEHDMGPMAGLFLAWCVLNDHEESADE